MSSTPDLDRAIASAAAVVVASQIKGGIADRYKDESGCRCDRGWNDQYCWRCVKAKCTSLGGHISIMSVFETNLDPETRKPLMQAIASDLDVKVQCRRAINQAILDACGPGAKIEKAIARRKRLS